MKPKVYIETSIVSYLVACPSRDLVVAANQQITRDWWDLRRPEFELYGSELVNIEAAAGDPVYARRRLEVLSALPVLSATEETRELAEKLIRFGPIPQKAARDALHIAVAAAHACEYLLTWNQRHIANAQMQRSLRTAVEESGFELPIICSPNELMGELGDYYDRA